MWRDPETDETEEDSQHLKTTRRNILKSTALASGAIAFGLPAASVPAAASSHSQSMTVASDTTAKVVGYRAGTGSDVADCTLDSADRQAKLTYVHPNWGTVTSQFDSGEWIWDGDGDNPVDENGTQYYVKEPVYGDVVKFEKTFEIPGTPTGGSMDITVDNGYELYVNGTLVESAQVHDTDVDWECSDLFESSVNSDGWQSIETVDIGSELVSGSNTLEILAANEFMGSEDGQATGTVLSNPAGLIFEADIQYVCSETYDLCAAQDIDVGTVTVVETEDGFDVTFQTTDGWTLTETHLDVGDEFEDFHTNNGGNPKIGQFDYSETHENVTSYTYPVSFDDGQLDDVNEGAECVLFAAHAVVEKVSETELVANGGLETPEVTHAAGWNIFDAGTEGLGWDVEWVNPDLPDYDGLQQPDTAHLELHAGVNGWSPYMGDQYAELDTDWDGPDGGVTGEPASVEISQDISTTGDTYQVTYAWSPRPGHDDNELEVYWDGEMVASHSADGSGNSDTDWTEETLVLEASGDTTTLMFVEAGTGDSFGMFLDAVSVREIMNETAWVCADESDPFTERGSWATYFEFCFCEPNGTDS